jgi:hypothetical protein
MGYRLFNVFSEVVDHTPASAVLAITDGERDILEQEWTAQDGPADQDIESILAFCNFLSTEAAGTTYPTINNSMAVPIDHFAFYRNTVERLADAWVLPVDAKQRFDLAFETSFTPESRPSGPIARHVPA